MRRVVIYWATKDKAKEREVRQALRIGGVSINGESEYNGDIERLTPYIEEGIMQLRYKADEEVRR